MERIGHAEREAQALRLRSNGLTFREIACSLEYADASGAYRAVQRALEWTVREPAEELRQLEAARLDLLTQALWPRAMDGEVRAVDRVLAIMERRAKLLGLDAPGRRMVDVISREAFLKMCAELEAEVREREAARGLSSPAPLAQRDRDDLLELEQERS